MRDLVALERQKSKFLLKKVYSEMFQKLAFNNRELLD
ncbi:MAG: hypothetical protein CLLPBCKN_006053 [Chroococcidiopsis cubana SAG 39.79]|nr:hypothetical protein [Chroococcidiopsis cubana SAG 39.79]